MYDTMTRKGTRLPTALALAILFGAMTTSTAVADSGAQAPRYYVALGDSLSVGVQSSPPGNVETNQGYANDLFLAERTGIPTLASFSLDARYTRRPRP